MLKKSEINKIAIDLKWKRKEVESAFEELLEAHSIIDCEGFLRVCAEANGPQERWNRIVNFLFKSLEFDLVETICELLKIDPCFRALALFNILNISKSQGLVGVSYWDNKSFFRWTFEWYLSRESNKLKETLAIPGRLLVLTNDPLVVSTESKHAQNQIKVLSNPLLFPDSMTYSFIQFLLINTPKKYKGTVDVEMILNDVASEVGILVFNIEAFRLLATVMWNNPMMDAQTDKLIKLISSFKKTTLSKEEKTKRKYWLIYAAVEKLREVEGYGLRESFRELAKISFSGPATIQARYFERKKELKDKNLDLNRIIKEFRLHNELDDLLIEASKEYKPVREKLKKVGIDEEEIKTYVKFLRTKRK